MLLVRSQLTTSSTALQPPLAVALDARYLAQTYFTLAVTLGLTLTLTFARTLTLTLDPDPDPVTLPLP